MWNISQTSDRLQKWKEFRRHINLLSFDDALKETVQLWSYAPFVNHYLDHSTPEDWPGPWDLVSDNVYDDMARALGMIYTLYLTDHGKQHSFTIALAQAGTTLENYNLALIDEGKYILNFQFNDIISKSQLDEDISFVTVYSQDDLQLHKY
jgi:hypothetical protein